MFGMGGGYFFEVFSEVVEALKTTIGYLKLRLTGRMLSDAGSMFIDSNDRELMALADLGLDVPRGGSFWWMACHLSRASVSHRAASSRAQSKVRVIDMPI